LAFIIAVKEKPKTLISTKKKKDSNGQKNFFISKIGRKSTFQMKVLLPQSIEENSMSENMIGKTGMMNNSENK